jgi:hypothetical protein
MSYIYSLIDLCQHVDVEYHNQSVIVLESTPVNRGVRGCSHFFDDHNVISILAIKRPHDSGQLYIAEGLSTKYHFSCPTAFLPSLVHSIQQLNNKDSKLLFIPRSMGSYKSNGITIYNDVSIPLIFRGEGANSLFHTVIQAGEKVAVDSIATPGKTVQQLLFNWIADHVCAPTAQCPFFHAPSFQATRTLCKEIAQCPYKINICGILSRPRSIEE